MATVFGDLARQADGHLAQVHAHLGVAGDGILGETAWAAASEIRRIAAVMARYAGTVIGGSAYLGAWRRYAGRIHDSLWHAVDALPSGPPSGDGQVLRPVLRDLAAMRITLAAGRDLLTIWVASDQAGSRLAYSRWSEAINSPPLTAALLGELARWSHGLASVTAQIADTGTPPLRKRLAVAGAHMAEVAGTFQEAALASPVDAAYRYHLLYAIPDGIPQRRPTADAEPLKVLCEAVTSGADRILAAAAEMAAQAMWSPGASLAALRRAATAAAVAGDSCQLILATAGQRCRELGATASLDPAASAMHHAWTTWHRASRTARPFITDSPAGGLSPLEAEMGDLVTRLGRIAYANSAWTPAQSRRAPPRGPADLAPDLPALADVVTAVHYTADTLARLGAAATQALRGAAATGRIYVPAIEATGRGPGWLPGHLASLVRGLAKAPPERAAALIEAYREAGYASAGAVIALDKAAVTLHSPSRILAATRPAQGAWHAAPLSLPAPTRSLLWRLDFPQVASAAPGKDFVRLRRTPWRTPSARKPQPRLGS